MSKKGADLQIERVVDVNDYFCDHYDYLKKMAVSTLDKGIHCFDAAALNGSRHFIKKCSKSYVCRSSIDNPWNEIRALSIVSMIDSKYFPHFIKAIEDDHYVCVISEFVDGIDLFTKIQSAPNGMIDVSTAQRYLIQISQAISHLHRHDLAHLDLSTENILVDKCGNIKLTDFGACTRIHHCKEEQKKSYSEHKEATHTYGKHISSRLLPGKSGYRAPEIEMRRWCDPGKCDAFSFGYIAWTMLNGNMPFECAHPSDASFQHFMKWGVAEWSKRISPSSHSDAKRRLPPNAIQMLSDLLVLNTYKRKTVEEVLSDDASFLHHEHDEKKCKDTCDDSRLLCKNTIKLDCT